MFTITRTCEEMYMTCHVDHFAAWALREALMRKPDCSVSYPKSSSLKWFEASNGCDAVVGKARCNPGIVDVVMCVANNNISAAACNCVDVAHARAECGRYDIAVA